MQTKLNPYRSSANKEIDTYYQQIGKFHTDYQQIRKFHTDFQQIRKFQTDYQQIRKHNERSG